ncbi:MAG: UDP-N-acetyl-D-galactosamine dehydrogenase [Flavobacteriales bacterium]|jgi:UDP-N-acetyl-D-galactosamine dehydrogenase
MIYDKLLKKESTLAVIGLGYVGLPIALEFARQIKVIGFDINDERIQMMKNHEDPSEELESSAFDGCDIEFTSNLEDLKAAQFFVIAVPTPINSSNQPDLGPVLSASRTVGKVLDKGDYVVYESTVYPGCTEEDCIPVLEEVSGLTFRDDFKVGYSPERINPGDKKHTIRTIIKVASGCSPESLEQIAQVYELVVDAGVHRAASIKVAEAAKVIENTQRDVNIALINELSIILNRLGVNTYDVLEAARTKWNFLPFMPGLVGGHCIGVDPYYLTYKAKNLGYHAKVINSGRYVNDSMGFYVGKQTVKRILEQGKNILEGRVLVMGVTFKEDVSDIRNSKVIDVIKELESFSMKVDLIDPHASPKEFKHEYDLEVKRTAEKGIYDAVIIAVNHEEYRDLSEDDITEYMNDDKGVLVDIKGVYRDRVKNLLYWSL